MAFDRNNVEMRRVLLFDIELLRASDFVNKPFDQIFLSSDEEIVNGVARRLTPFGVELFATSPYDYTPELFQSQPAIVPHAF